MFKRVGRKTLQLRFLGALLLVIGGAASLVAVPPVHSEESVEISTRLQTLDNIVRTQEQLRADRSIRQTELSSEAARGREDELRGAIRQLSDAIRQLDRAFGTIASEVDPESLEEQDEFEDVQLTTAIQELLSPLVSELKRATARPREIDRLRTEISESNERLATVKRAIKNLGPLLDGAGSDAVRAALQAERDSWLSRSQSENTKLTVAHQKLDQQLSGQRSWSQSLDDIFELFFKSRGRNLVIALLATLTFWFLLRRAHHWLRRSGPLSRAGSSLWARVFDLAYMLFTAVGALCVFIIILYSFGDWVLLVVVVLILAGLAWASKQAIPRFWSQATLLLDMGPVRDGERVIYQQIPYRVDSLGLYTQLANPLLAGGPVRLPIADLSALRSRPAADDEPWFPTQQGDWIVLPDGTYGQIELQTIETVRLRRWGATHRSYPTAEFMALAPDVISKGFLVVVHFGIDYRHQAQVTREVVATLRDFIERGIEASGRDAWTVSLEVEFSQAAASSLDLVVLWQVSGEAAPAYYSVRRMINRLCVEACNEHGWEIPFQQVTVHQASQAPD